MPSLAQTRPPTKRRMHLSPSPHLSDKQPLLPSALTSRAMLTTISHSVQSPRAMHRTWPLTVRRMHACDPQRHPARCQLSPKSLKPPGYSSTPPYQVASLPPSSPKPAHNPHVPSYNAPYPAQLAFSPIGRGTDRSPYPIDSSRTGGPRYLAACMDQPSMLCLAIKPIGLEVERVDFKRVRKRRSKGERS